MLNWSRTRYAHAASCCAIDMNLINPVALPARITPSSPGLISLASAMSRKKQQRFVTLSSSGSPGTSPSEICSDTRCEALAPCQCPPDCLASQVDPLDKARPGYCGGAVMFENLGDVMRHCDGSLHDAGLAPGAAIVMYDMRCAPFDDIVACEHPDLGRNVGIDDTKAAGMGLIDVVEREVVHPLAVEYPHDPFENPKPLIQGHHPFSHVALSVEDLTWFEIFFKLLSEKGNYKLNYYIPSRVRCKVSSGDASTLILKANKSDLVANRSRFQDGLNQRPKGDRKATVGGRSFGAAGAARERIKGSVPGRMSNGSLGTVR